MAVFQVGSLVAKLRLDIGEWRRSMTNVMSDATRMQRGLGGITRSAMVLTRTFGLIGAAGAVAFRTVGNSFVRAAATIENYTMTLRLMLRSQEEANRVVADMGRIAKATPLEFEDVLKTSVQLAGVFKGSADDIRAWMPLILDLASVLQPLGVSLEETTIQFVRMYSAGAASADLFREKGVLGMLGFNPGEITTAMETRKRLFEEWSKDTSFFRGASDELTKTWDGQVGKMKDTWFQFRTAVMDTGIFDGMKNGLTALNNSIDKNWDSILGWIDANKEMIRDVVYTTAGVTALGIAFGTLALVLPVILQMLTLIAGLFSLAGLAAVGLAASIAFIGVAGYAIAASIRQNVGNIQKDWEHLVTVFNKVFSFMYTFAKLKVENTAKLFKWLFNTIVGGVAAAVAVMEKMNSIVFASPSEKLNWLINGSIADIPALAKETAKEAGDAFGKDYWAELGGVVEEGAEIAYEGVAALSVITRRQITDDINYMMGSFKEAHPLITKILSDMEGAMVPKDHPDNFFDKLPTFGGAGPADTKGAAKALKEYTQALKEAITLRESVRPIEALASEVVALEKMADRFGNIIDQETMLLKMKELWTSYRDNGGSATADLTDMTSQLGEETRRTWELARLEAEDYFMLLEDAKKTELTINPQIEKGMNFLDQAGAGIVIASQFEERITAVNAAVSALIANGDMTQEQADNMLSPEFWQRLSDGANYSLQELVDAIHQPGLSPQAFNALSEAITKNLKEGALDSATDSANMLAGAFDSMGASGAAKAVRAISSISSGMNALVTTITSIPLLFAAMAAAGVSAAVVIGTAMLIAFNIIALIAMMISTVIALFGGMGKTAEEELTGMSKVIDEIKQQSEQWIQGLTDSIIEFARTGKQTFKDFADSVLDDILSISLAELVIRPAVGAIGGMFFKSGGAFVNGQVQKFGAGGIVDSPTVFSHKGGLGIAGEAGTEVIAPLRRMGNGDMGIAAVGGGGNTNINVYASDIPKENIQVSSKRGPHGDETIDIVVTGAVRKALHRGVFSKDLSQLYGLTRNPA